MLKIDKYVKKVRHMVGGNLSTKIFVIGTGRSGTHWLARILKSHPKIRATIEVNPGFRWVTEMAVDPSTRANHYSKLVWYYRWQHLRSVPQHYLDKSHPNLWIADQLAKTFDDALFLGIQRNPYATVASMLNHEGVKKWHKNWRNYPVPNSFLGIRRNDIDRYDDLTLATQCTMRWKAHYDRMRKMDRCLESRMMLVKHESLVRNHKQKLNEIEKFIGIDNIEMTQINYNTIDKWKDRLTGTQIDNIKSISGVKPHEISTRYDI